MARVSSRIRWVVTAVAIALLGHTLIGQSPASQLAPTGTLRAVFLGGNPVQGRVDAKSGEASGTVRDLARRLGVPAAIASAPNAAALIAALNGGSADIGFLAYDEMRAAEVDFGPPFIAMGNSYLVKATSTIKASGDVDRTGITVAAVK